MDTPKPAAWVGKTDNAAFEQARQYLIGSPEAEWACKLLGVYVAERRVIDDMTRHFHEESGRARNMALREHRLWEEARALLERFASQLRQSYRDDGSRAGEGFNISLIEQLQFCREVRAFLAGGHNEAAGE